MVNFALPPDNRTVGSGNPPLDMNDVVDALTAIGTPFNVLNSAYSGGADPTGGTDSTSAFQGAITAAAGAPVYVPPGTYTIAGNLTATVMPFYMYGSGRRITVINQTGSGDMLRVYRAGSYLGYPSGEITGITINGSSAAAGACGLHLGDVFQFRLDVEVTHYSGAGSIGVHLDNTRYWTEQLHGQIFAQFCTTGVMFDNSANITGSATGSFDRANLDIYIDQGGFGDGVTLANGAFITDGHLGIWGNFVTATTQYACLRLTGSDAGGFSSLATVDLQIGVELDDTVHLAPYTIFFGSTSNTIYACTGRVAFGFEPWTASNAHSNSFRFQGIILGDFNLTSSDAIQPYSSVTAMANAATITHGYAGAIYVTNGGTSYTGIIMQAGSFAGQQVMVINTGAGTLTFDVAGTSNVVSGNSCVIAGNSTAGFLWVNSTWYPVGPASPPFNASSLALAPSGATAETFPRTDCAASYPSALVSQTVYYTAIILPAGLPVNNLTMLVGNVAAAATPTHGWYALLDSSRVVRAVSADQTSAWASTFSQVPLSVSGSAYTTTYAGLYYMCVCITSAAAMPVLLIANPVVGNPGSYAPVLCGTGSTTSTTPPATGTTMTAISYAAQTRFYGYTS